jgi:CBS-domain-containing membrane protein
MTCRTLMAAPAATVAPEDAIGAAAARLAAGALPALPVIAADGRYLGLFGRRELLALLLPRAAALGGGDEDLAWMDESLPEMAGRFGRAASGPVASHLARAPALGPDAGAAEAVRLLAKGAPLVPIVDERGMLLGIVTADLVLARVMG